MSNNLMKNFDAIATAMNLTATEKMVAKSAINLGSTLCGAVSGVVLSNVVLGMRKKAMMKKVNSWKFKKLSPKEQMKRKAAYNNMNVIIAAMCMGTANTAVGVGRYYSNKAVDASRITAKAGYDCSRFMI